MKTMIRNYALILIILLSRVFLFNILSANAQCYDITDDLNNSSPTFTYNFTLTPDASAGASTYPYTMRFRTSDTNAWKVTASRVAITRTTGTGATADNILDTDVTWSGTLTPVGPPTGTASLTAPFNGTTTLNSISTAGGTVVITGNNRSFTSCTNAMGLLRYWELDTVLSVPQDFVFNPGTYMGSITYTISN